MKTIGENVTWRCRMYTCDLSIRLHKVVPVEYPNENKVWDNVRLAVENVTDGVSGATCIKAFDLAGD
jgi:hypothetical protein